MGFEHQIHFCWTDKNQEEIQTLLTGHAHFSKVITIDNKKFFEFRKMKMDNNMPDFSIAMEKNGLYICNHLNSKSGADIDFIMQYLKENKLDYKVEEL